MFHFRSVACLAAVCLASGVAAQELHLAADRGQLETVKGLLEAGADVNEKDRNQRTARIP